MRRFLAVLAIVALVQLAPHTAHAQDSEGSGTNLADTTAWVAPTPWETRAHDVEQVHGHKFWRGTGELFIAQAIPWAYNYYVRDADFARISLNSWEANLQWWEVWEWDDNNFKTNQFAHPYHGNLYFNAFRSNGHSFWESVPAAFAGSLTWECFGETHPPAPNDFLNTSLGGIALGETTHRLSALILDETDTGGSRTWREIGAFLVDPMRGFNRLLDGKWNDVGPNPADWRPARLASDARIGVRRIGTEVGDLVEDGPTQFSAELGLVYGRPMVDVKKPFSSFQFRIEYASEDSVIFPMISARGILHGWQLENSQRTQHTAGLWMNYDYLNNEAVEYGGQAFTLGMLSRWAVGNGGGAIATDVGVTGVPIAAVPEDYLTFGEGRDYDFCMGGGLRLGLAYDRPRWRILSLGYTGLYLPVVNGLDATHYVHALNGTLQVPVAKNLAIGAQAGHYFRHSDYADYDDVEQKNPYGRLFVTIKDGWDRPVSEAPTYR